MQKSTLRYFPIALFSSVMGLAAVTMAARQIEITYDTNHITSTILISITSLWFLFNLLVFIYRLLFFPKEVKQEFSHPIQMNFFAAISISFLLLATIYAPLFESFSYIVWGIGAVLQLSFTLIFLHNLIWKEAFDFNHFTPLSFLPIVGNLVVPIGGSFHVHEQINWFFFGFGILFSVIYIAFLFNRLFFKNPLPPKMLPTIFILMAPPALAFIAYTNIRGTIDIFSNILFGIALFIGLLLLLQLRQIFTNPFALPYWALLFPSGAMTIATIIMHRETDFLFYAVLNVLQMFGLVLFALYLSWKTIELAREGKLCAPEQ